MIDVLSILVGIVLLVVYERLRPAFFRREVPRATTAMLVPEDLGAPVGLFGVGESREVREGTVPS